MSDALTGVNVIRELKPAASGDRRLVIDLPAGTKLLAIREDTFYKLGYPCEEVVGSHILTEAKQVTWCSASQEWA